MKILPLKPVSLLIACLFTLHAHAAQTTRYVIQAESGAKIGEQVVERGDDGLTKVKFYIKDNGRGPELEETFRFAKDGSLSAYSAKGKSELGAEVNDNFKREGERAEWRSASEGGQANIQGKALYLPLVSSFEVNSQAIAMLGAEGGTLRLLPAGSLQQKKLDSIEIEQNGKKRRLNLLLQSGPDLYPSMVWASVEAQPRLFANVDDGLKLIEQGWESHLPRLRDIQKKIEEKLLQEMAQRLQKPLSGLTVIRNARIFDSETAQLTAAKDVYVLRGRISAILPAGSSARGAQAEIDAKGQVMLPGLFDMHGHTFRREGGLHLAAGVTTVRDMGNDNQHMQLMLDEKLQGKLLAPHVVATGFLEGDSPFASNGGFIVNDLNGAKAAIDWYAQHGYPQLKVYNSFPKAILPQTVAYAHQMGMRVSGHVPVGLRASEALDYGYDEIQHINQLLLNFLVTPETETRNLNRFILPAEKVADLDFDSAPVQQLITRMRDKQIVLDPTLSAFSFFKHRSGEVDEPYINLAKHMPLNSRRNMYLGGMEIKGEAQYQRYKKSYDKMVEFVGRLHKAGVPLVAGTDGLAGIGLHAELGMMVKAGLSPAHALQVATRNGARYTRTSHERGSIEVGKLADLVLVDGEPTQNIADLHKVSLVITNGKLLRPQEIFREYGIEPFTASSPALLELKDNTPPQRPMKHGGRH